MGRNSIYKLSLLNTTLADLEDVTIFCPLDYALEPVTSLAFAKRIRKSGWLLGRSYRIDFKEHGKHKDLIVSPWREHLVLENGELVRCVSDCDLPRPHDGNCESWESWQQYWISRPYYQGAKYFPDASQMTSKERSLATIVGHPYYPTIGFIKKTDLHLLAK